MLLPEGLGAWRVIVVDFQLMLTLRFLATARLLLEFELDVALLDASLRLRVSLWPFWLQD